MGVLCVCVCVFLCVSRLMGREKLCVLFPSTFSIVCLSVHKSNCFLSWHGCFVCVCVSVCIPFDGTGEIVCIISIILFDSLSISLSVCLSSFSIVCLSVCSLSVCLSVCLSIVSSLGMGVLCVCVCIRLMGWEKLCVFFPSSFSMVCLSVCYSFFSLAHDISSYTHSCL